MPEQSNKQLCLQKHKKQQKNPALNCCIVINLLRTHSVPPWHFKTAVNRWTWTCKHNPTSLNLLNHLYDKNPSEWKKWHLVQENGSAISSVFFGVLFFIGHNEHSAQLANQEVLIWCQTVLFSSSAHKKSSLFSINKSGVLRGRFHVKKSNVKIRKVSLLCIRRL